MPSIVYTSPSLAANRLAIVSEDASEQANGLVNVAVQYVTTVANRDRAARAFYSDAPPPVFPASVNRDDLQTRNLYMISRSIEQSAGLVYIKADYAGALQRGNSYLVNVGKETKQTTYAWRGSNYGGNPIEGIPQQQFVDYRATYVWTALVYQYEYAAIGAYSAATALPDTRIMSVLEDFYGASPFQEFIGSDSQYPYVLYGLNMFRGDAERLMSYHILLETESLKHITPTVTLRQKELFMAPRQQIDVQEYQYKALLLAR